MRCSAAPYAPGFGSESVHPASSCWTCSRNAASACGRTGAAPTSACTASLERRRTSEWERSEEHTSELQSPCNLVCRLLLEKKKKTTERPQPSTLTSASSYHRAY